jgi:hypothetical protein
MPELRFEDIGRGSLAYRTKFDPEDPGIGPNPLLALGAFLGAKLVAKGAKWGTELWEKTGGKALQDLKAGLFGKGTRNAAEVGKAIEEDALKEAEKGAADGLAKQGITGKAIEGGAIAKAAGSGEKLGVKEGEKIGAEVLVKEGEKGAAKTLGKKLPGVALLIGGYFAWDRWSKERDLEGAKAELESGATASVPGVGTVASIVMDASLLERDKLREQMASVGIDPNRKLSPTGELISNIITRVIPAGGLIENSTRTFVSALEGFCEKGGLKELGEEKLSAFSEGALAVENALGGNQLAEMTRPLAALAEDMLGLHEHPQTVNATTPEPAKPPANFQTGVPAPETAQSHEEESRLRDTLRAEAPERAALQTEASYSGHPTAVNQVDADQARDLERTYEQTQFRLQSLEDSRLKSTQKVTPSPEVLSPGTANLQKQNTFLLATIRAVQPSSNLRPYLPASLRGADRSGVNTARAVGKEREAIDRFMVSLNVAPLSAHFRNAIRSQEREKEKEITKVVQEEQTVDA